MRVLHVVSVSFSLTYFIGNQFKHFAEKGIEFYVACSPSEHLFEYAEQMGFKVVPVNIVRAINPIADVKAINQLVKVIKDRKIDIVIGHTPKGGLVAMIAATLAGVSRRIYFRHGLVYESAKGTKRRLLKSIEQLTGHLAHKVVCVSQSIKRISDEKHLSKKASNMLLGEGTCNGVDSEAIFSPLRFDEQARQLLRNELDINVDAVVYGFVGRLVKDKGIGDLICAWKEMLKARTNIKLLLIGPLEERDALPSDLVAFIKREPTITLVGEVRETAKYYSIMDVFVLPSYREGFPTVVLEASSMQLPVITTKVTGCVDSIVEGVTGLFCENSCKDLAEKMLVFYEDRDKAKSMGVKGREYVKAHFAQERIWKHIEENVLNK